MKKITKLVTLTLGVIMIMTSLTACAIFKLGNSDDGNGTSNIQAQTITVHYYDGKTMTYTSSAGDKSIQTNFIAPTGKIIVGLFDENDIQYATYDCIVDLISNAVVPSTLYAKYEDVDISYLDSDPFSAYDEDPQAISYYSGGTLTWEFNPSEYPDDQKMISACLCNPYADLIITVSFYGKTTEKNNHDNSFTSKLIVCDETIGSFDIKDFASASSYTKYSYKGTIKAKQLTNGDYEVRIKTSAKYGYADYTIKNYRIDFDFVFNYGE